MTKKKELDIYNFKGTGLFGIDKRRAKKRFEEYKKRYHIGQLSDLQLLEEKVFREVQQEQLKEKIGEVSKSEGVKDTKHVPIYLLNELNKNLEQILLIDEKLGLFEDKEKQDAFQHIQTLKNKFKIWQQENQGSRTAMCPHCGQMILFTIRVDKYDANKHPFFKDRILTNKHLLKLYKENKITKEDVAKVLGVSPDYIDWLIDKICPPEK